MVSVRTGTMKRSNMSSKLARWRWSQSGWRLIRTPLATLPLDSPKPLRLFGWHWSVPLFYCHLKRHVCVTINQLAYCSSVSKTSCQRCGRAKQRWRQQWQHQISILLREKMEMMMMWVSWSTEKFSAGKLSSREQEHIIICFNPSSTNFNSEENTSNYAAEIDAQILWSKEECVSGMGKRRNVAEKDAQTILWKGESASGKGQMSNNVAEVDAQITLRKEECVFSMG